MDPQLSVLDKPRSGCPRFARTAHNIRHIQQLLRQDSRHSIRELATLTRTSVGSAHRIVTKELKLHKIASRFIPKLLNDEQKQCHHDICQHNLDRLAAEPLLLRQIITGDKSWVHCYEPHLKQKDMSWLSRNDPHPNKAIRGQSTKKIMLTAFFDDTATVHHEFTCRSINRHSYTHILGRLQEKVRRKRPGMWHPAFGRERAMVLLHDNASPHRALQTRAHLRASGVTVLEHPPYSPDLSLCDYFLFPWLKHDLRGRRFATLDDLQDAIDVVLRQIPVHEYQAAILDLPR